MQVKNSTGDDVREGVRVTSLHVEDLKDSRGEANFALKWVKDARKAAFLTVVPIIAFDCRGMDVIGFHPEVKPLSLRTLVSTLQFPSYGSVTICTFGPLSSHCTPL